MKTPLARRGMMAAAMGMAAAARALGRAQAAPPPPGDMMVDQAMPSSGLLKATQLPEAEWRRKHDLLEAFVSSRRRAEHRREIRERLLGLYPPGIASNHSWAPWFKAQVAARQIEQERWEASDWFEQARRRIFGD